MKRGDRRVDALYGTLRTRFGRASARANGYRYERYFRREQALLLDLIAPRARIVVDVCCGSGLMLLPLAAARDPARLVFGIEFNAAACRAAADNGFPVVRGDAFALPLAAASVEALVNCQFFNQQPRAQVAAFLDEVARVLAPGGQAIVVWRNGAALIHRVAHALLTRVDRLRGLPCFPQHVHRLHEVEALARAAGLDVAQRELTCPPLGWRLRATTGWRAHCFGASCVLVVTRPV